MLLLQRVDDGAITKYGGFYFDAGRRINFFSAEHAYATLVEVGRLELVYPPDSGVHRQKDYEPGELVRGVHVGLTKAELTRTAVFTELGMREYKELLERANPAN